MIDDETDADTDDKSYETAREMDEMEGRCYRLDLRSFMLSTSILSGNKHPRKCTRMLNISGTRRGGGVSAARAQHTPLFPIFRLRACANGKVQSDGRGGSKSRSGSKDGSRSEDSIGRVFRINAHDVRPVDDDKQAIRLPLPTRLLTIMQA